jgi:hypothetical protein
LISSVTVMVKHLISVVCQLSFSTLLSKSAWLDYWQVVP